MKTDQLAILAESIVAATIAELPAKLRDRMRSVPVLIEGTPSPFDLEVGIEPDTLGFFDEDIEGLARIRLWIENIHALASDENLPFEDEVRTTLLHEIGHLVGWDEDDLDERGLR